MLTNKGKSIIARSLCEQINDPLSYIAVGSGQWKDNEIRYKQQLCFETDRFKVGAYSPFEINQQIAVVLNATMPASGMRNISEMAIFTASKDTLLETNPSETLFVSGSQATSFDDATINSSQADEIIRRTRGSSAPHEIKFNEELIIDVENMLGDKYYEGDLIKFGTPLAYTIHGQVLPHITFVDVIGEQVSFKSLRQEAFDGLSQDQDDHIVLEKQGEHLAQNNWGESDFAKYYWVEGFVLRSEVLQKIVERLGKIKYIKIKNPPPSAPTTDYPSFYIDSVAYESVNTLNPGYAMVAYLAVNTGYNVAPYIKKIDGAEAIISYELLIGDPGDPQDV